MNERGNIMIKKKYLLLVVGLIVIISIAGCTVRSNKQKNVEDPKKIEEQMAQTEKREKEKIERDFEVLIKENSEPYKLVKYIDENISRASFEFAEKMVIELERMQESYAIHYMDELFKGDRQSTLAKVFPNYEFDSSKINIIEDEELKKLVTDIVDGKYKIVNAEGAFYPAIDYKVLNGYKQYISDEISEYLEIMAIHLDNPPMIDAALTISWDDLSDRLINTEKYLRKYVDGVKSEEITRLYGEYLVMYMQGGDNTPIYNKEDKKIIEDVLNSYKKTIANDKEGITGSIISKYLKVIEENNYIIDDVVTSKIIDLNNEAIGNLEEHK